VVFDGENNAKITIIPISGVYTVYRGGRILKTFLNLAEVVEYWNKLV